MIEKKNHRENDAFERETLVPCGGSKAESSAVWAESGMMTSGKLNHSAVLQLIKAIWFKKATPSAIL